MRQDLESRYQEFGRNNLAILILGMILVKIVHKIFSLGRAPPLVGVDLSSLVPAG